MPNAHILDYTVALWEVYALAAGLSVASAHIAAWYEVRFWQAL